MRLTDEERAMLAGELGEPRRWAIAHQIAVGEFFDAADLVPVSQAHIMADTESRSTVSRRSRASPQERAASAGPYDHRSARHRVQGLSPAWAERLDGGARA